MPIIYPQITKAGRWDTIIQQGSSYARTFNFINLDLTGLSVRGSIKRAHRDRRPITTYDCKVKSKTEVDVQLTPAKSYLLPAEIVVHDIEIYHAVDGVDVFVARVMEGKIRVTAEVTK